MLALPLLWLVLAAPLEVTVVERSTLGVPPAAGAELRGRLRAALEQEGLVASLSPRACADRECLVMLARDGATCAVGMTVVKNKKGLTIDLEAVTVDGLLLQETFLLAPRDVLERSPQVRAFGDALKRRLTPDTPVATPAPSPARPLPDVDRPLTAAAEVTSPRPEWTEPPPRSAALPALGVASSVVGAGGLALLIASAVVKGQLDAALAQQPVITTLTRAEAQSQAATANTLLGTGLAALALGVAGGATAFALALGERPEGEPLR